VLPEILNQTCLEVMVGVESSSSLFPILLAMLIPKNDMLHPFVVVADLHGYMMFLDVVEMSLQRV
jgi:hypothetical protein